MLDPGSRLPTFVYIDECHDYIANEEKIAELIDKARKQRVSFTFAHQRLSNIKSPNVLDALSNVGIRMASRNETDATVLAKRLNTTPEYITNQPIGTFATYIRGHTPTAIRTTFPHLMFRADGARLADLRNRMHKQYSTSIHAAPSPPPSRPPIAEPDSWQKGW